MKFSISLLLVIFLSGCSLFPKSIPKVPNFPSTTEELMKKCKELKTIEGDEVLITDMLKVIVQNYTFYYECSNKVENWQDWYIQQKKIFDKLK